MHVYSREHNDRVSLLHSKTVREGVCDDDSDGDDNIAAVVLLRAGADHSRSRTREDAGKRSAKFSSGTRSSFIDGFRHFSLSYTCARTSVIYVQRFPLLD